MIFETVSLNEKYMLRNMIKALNCKSNYARIICFKYTLDSVGTSETNLCRSDYYMVEYKEFCKGSEYIREEYY